MVLLVTGLFFKGKVNYKSLWSVLGSGDLCSTTPSYEECNPPRQQLLVAMSSLRAQAKAGHRDILCLAAPEKEQVQSSHAAFWILQHPLMDTTGLGSASCPTRSWWHPESCPKGLVWTWFQVLQSTDVVQGPSEGPSAHD